MKTILLFLALVIVSGAQTNEPVIQVKQFRAGGECKVTLGTRGDVRTLRGEILSVYSNRFMLQSDDSGKEIIIQNYPRMDSLANGQKVSIYAQKIGTIQGLNMDGTPAIGEVLELWDYWAPRVPTPEEIAAAKAAQEKAKSDAKAKFEASKKAGELRALKANQDAAAKGDTFGLMRMGERYRDGEGVEKDLIKAREYLQKAVDADASNFVAKDELSKLSSP